jgi:hypothetical protein
MEPAEFLTTAAACGALLVSAVSAAFAARSARETRRQADVAELATEHAQQSGVGAIVIHFTSRFFELMKDGPRFDDPAWTYQYWSLQATEFYFFDNGWLPSFLYELWMVEMVTGYRSFPETKDSHRHYLDRYAANYPSIVSFFAHLADIATTDFDSERDRNLAVSELVSSWRQGTAPAPRQRGTSRTRV